MTNAKTNGIVSHRIVEKYYIVENANSNENDCIILNYYS